MKENLKQYTLTDMKTRMVTYGLDPYRGEQVFKWMWQKNLGDFNNMTNISKTLRAELAQYFTITKLGIDRIITGNDKAQKLLMRLIDDTCIEAVYIPEDRRQTVCVSTQVGCPFKCAFCATGLMEFKRDLKAHEIADQVRTIQEHVGRKVTNVVFMGMGEPLLNTANVCDAIDTMCSPMGLGISQHHITVSTIGLIPGMKQLYESSFKVKLAISLNFPNRAQRETMMPGTKKNPLPEVLELARQYSQDKAMVTFEYVIIGSLNDKLQDARTLLNLIKEIPSKINLIPYNPYPGLPFNAPSEPALTRFHDFLLNSPHTITLRRPRGSDISAACGQLAII